MRRALAIFTIAVLLAGCAPKQTEPFPTEVTLLDSSGYVVDGIMEYPDYTFDGTPTTDELRQTAVRAFRDLLTVRWSTIAPIIYEKAGPVSGKTFTHQPDVTYAGKEGEEAAEATPINDVNPLWLRQPSEITEEEYDAVLSWMYLNELEGFTQEAQAADTCFIPDF